MKKIPRLLGNCMQIPPRVMAKLALQIKYDPPKYHNREWESVISIRHQLIPLIMFFNFFKWTMICNIRRVTFIEIALEKFALLARLDIGKVEYMVLRLI